MISDDNKDIDDILECLEKQGWSKLIKNVKNGKASLCY